MMRYTTEAEVFPYNAKTTYIITVDEKGNVKQVNHNKAEIAAAYKSALSSECKLYAVWLGQYRSDLFAIDDLNAFADAFGIQRPDEHVHDVEWNLDSYDDGKSRSAWVSVRFRCGCSIEKMGIRKFASDMYEQKGWDVAVSKGYSMHSDGKTTTYTIPVRRNTLK